jgi:HD superfamily phosphohydrolase YqeK
MIDIINAKKEFKKYISNYNPEHPRVALKISHIGRVTENCKMIAEYLGLSDEEVKLAQLIGLFHDIGRFEQVRIADTFSDKDSGVNHAELSNKVLFEDGLIRNFIEDDSYDKIIKTAVYNHNRACIEKNISERELLFSKIIRDADKLDIFYITTFESFPALFWYKDFNQEEISSIVISQVEQKSLVDYQYVKNNADQITIFYAYIFDLYFDITLQKIVENKYLETYTENVKKNFKSAKIHEQANHLLQVCNTYIKQKTERM